MELIDGTIEFDVADDGTLVYQPAEPIGDRRLVWVDRQGQVQPLADAAGGLRVSQRSHRMAAASPCRSGTGPRHDIWVYEFATGSLTKITTDGTSTRPIWTPDGKRRDLCVAAPGWASHRLAAARWHGRGNVARVAATTRPFPGCGPRMVNG